MLQLVTNIGLAVPGLVAKMVRAGVVTKHKRDLAFTDIFGKHVYVYVSREPLKMQSISGWRDMLAAFNPGLSRLSAEEVAAVATLLFYHLNI